MHQGFVAGSEHANIESVSTFRNAENLRIEDRSELNGEYSQLETHTGNCNGGDFQSEALDLSGNCRGGDSNIDPDGDIDITDVSQIEEITDTFPEDTHIKVYSRDYGCDVDFEEFSRNIESTDISHVVASEDFLLDFLQHKMDNGMPDDVIKTLTQINSVTDPRFLQFWDEAHYTRYQQSTTIQLTALQKHRIRKRNEPPSGICAGGERPTLRMSDEARAILQGWYKSHAADPYPSRKKKERLAELSGITLSQVNTWFSNARRKRGHRKRRVLSNQENIQDNNGYSATITTVGTSEPSIAPPLYDNHGEVGQSERSTSYGSPVADGRIGQPSGHAWRFAFNNTPVTIPTPVQPAVYDDSYLAKTTLGHLRQPRLTIHHTQSQVRPTATQNIYQYGPSNQWIPGDVMDNGLKLTMANPNGLNDYRSSMYVGPAGFVDVNGLNEYQSLPNVNSKRVDDGSMFGIYHSSPYTTHASVAHTSPFGPSQQNDRLAASKVQNTPALQRLRTEQKQSEAMIQDPVCYPSAIESLLSLRKLCDRLEDTVVSPIDFAMNVDFSGVETGTGNCDVTQTRPSLTRTEVYNCTSVSSPWIPGSSPNLQWTRIVDISPPFWSPVNKEGRIRSYNTCLNSTPPSHVYDPTSALSPDQWNQCCRETVQGSSQSTVTTPSLGPDHSETLTEVQKDGNGRDIVDLQVSYGTIVGEAIQGLLNLSSQEYRHELTKGGESDTS